MKIFATLLFSTISTFILSAAPINKSYVAKEAKWVLHIDTDRFEDTAIGKFATAQLNALMKKEIESLPIGIDVEAILNDLNSVTAYGYTFEENPEKNSVLIISAGEQLQAIIDAFAANEEMNAEEGESCINVLDNTPHRTYLIDNEVYMSFPSQDLTIISKSLEQIEKTLRVIEGKEENLIDSKSTLVIEQDRGFFLLASVQGLDGIKNMPPQARILNKASGGQFSLGEDEQNLTAQLVLSTRNSETSTQLARIVQGMVALISFIDFQEANLDELAQNIVVSNNEKQVSIDLSFPFAEIERLIELAQSEQKKSNHKRRRHHERSDFHQEVDDSTGGEVLEIRSVVSLSDDGNIALNAIDNDPNTRWSTHGTGQWIRFELEDSFMVRELSVAWHKGHQRISKFSVETSDDGNVWNRLINKESTGETQDPENYNIPDTATRWIRLKCYGNTENAWNSIRDVSIIGSPVDSEVENMTKEQL